MLKPLFLSLLLVSSIGAAQAASTTYTLEPTHTQVLFSYSHLGFSNITLRFDTVEGTITYDPAAPAKSTVNVTIPTASISTGVAKFDEHIKAPDFFDVAKYPTATFKSTKVAAAGQGKLKVTGDLMIHGVTKSVVMDVTTNKIGTHPRANVPAAGFDGAIKIKRSDFGVGAYAPAVGDDVTIKITVEALGPKAK
jgi:polyisoprenoid-binding protein YceI